jgi:hypothetical protein
MVLASINITAVPEVPPNFTDGVATNPVPEMTTASLPAVEPYGRKILVTVGAATA